MSTTQYYDFTYTSTEWNISAVLGVQLVSGDEYNVVSITGSIDGTPITSLEPTGGYESNDNLLFTTAPYLDYSGISFDTSTDQFNVYYNSPETGYGVVDDSGDTGGGGTITLDAACFCPGTRLLTERGYIAVEALRESDRICTLSGALRPVRWIGRSRVDLRRHPQARENSPIRIARDAFAEGVPVRDVWVSPGHNLYWNGALVFAAALVNGATITRVAVPSVEYWHVELDRHDIMFADGLPAESYLDAGNRACFENGAEFAALHPDFTPRPATDTCAPLLQTVADRAGVRAALLARAGELGWHWDRDPDLHLLCDGVRIAPSARKGDEYRFIVPAGTARVELCSRSWTPAEATAASGDARELGVCVTAMRQDGRAADLAGLAGVAGWHAPERNGAGSVWVWTNGRALLPANLRELDIRTVNREAAYLVQPAHAEMPQLRVA